MPPLSSKAANALLALALFGLLVPNGIFLYCFATDPAAVRGVLTNPLALVFVAEAFFLMILFAWLIKKAGLKQPGGLAFVVMSLIGSMAFSVPAALYLWAKNEKRNAGTETG